MFGKYHWAWDILILLSMLNQSELASSLFGTFSIQLACIVKLPVYAV